MAIFGGEWEWTDAQEFASSHFLSGLIIQRSLYGFLLEFSSGYIIFVQWIARPIEQTILSLVFR
jgi:hypothetical protein